MQSEKSLSIDEESGRKLTTLNCRYYGFECNFEVNGDAEKIVSKMRQHTFDEHKVDLTKEYLSQVILRKVS